MRLKYPHLQIKKTGMIRFKEGVASSRQCTDDLGKKQ